MEKKRNRYSMDYEDQETALSSGTANQSQSSRKSSSRTATRNNSYKSSSSYRSASQRASDTTYRSPSQGSSGTTYRSPSQRSSGTSYRSPSQGTSGTTYRSPSQGTSGTTYRSPSQGTSGTTYRSPSQGTSGTTYRSPSQGSSGTTYRSPSSGNTNQSYRDPSSARTERLSRSSVTADDRARKKRRTNPDGSSRSGTGSARRPADRQRAEQRRKERREWARWQKAHWIVRALIVIVLVADILVLKFGGLTGGIPTVISLLRTMGKSNTTTQTASASSDLVTIDEQLLTINEYSRPGIALDEVNGLVIHYIGNAGTTAQENRDYFENLQDGSTGVYASCNYIVGLDGEIIQCVPDDEVAYASGERNSDTLSIEFCHTDDTGCPGEATNSSLVLLCAQLCDKYDLDPTTDIIRHYDISGKNCPKYFVDNADAWTAFLQQVADNM